MLERVSARQFFVLSVLLVLVAIAAALYLQYSIGVAPCPLCVLQRMGIIGAAIFALLAALSGRGVVRPILGLLALVAAVAGGGVAAWHTWLLAHPPETLGCGRPFEWFNEDFPLVTWLPRLFRGEGDCLSTEWTFLGLGIPHLSGLTSIALIALLLAGTLAAVRERRGP